MQLKLQGYTDADTLVIARLERRMVQNIATGVNMLSQECNSHYHASLCCIRKVDAAFSGNKLVIPTEVKNQLSAIQKNYLQHQLLVPMESLY